MMLLDLKEYAPGDYSHAFQVALCGSHPPTFPFSREDKGTERKITNQSVRNCLGCWSWKLSKLGDLDLCPIS